jgi:hypothetical protein
MIGKKSTTKTEKNSLAQQSRKPKENSSCLFLILTSAISLSGFIFFGGVFI